jgi:hypothetical protein
MKVRSLLISILAATAVAFAGACGGSQGESIFDAGQEMRDGGSSSSDGGSDDGNRSKIDSGQIMLGEDGGTVDATTGGGTSGTLSKVHIEPADDTITVKAGATGSVTYKVMGVIDGSGAAQDVTSRFVFYVPDNYLVAEFPAKGTPTLTTRLPAKPTDPPQQGGTLTVQAQAQNPGGKLLTVTTGLTVKLDAQLSDPSGAAIPTNPQTLFGGPVDATRAPVVAYPNNGTMLPPNLQQLEVHWTPGSANNTTLYRVQFASSLANIVYYVRCGTVSNGALVAGACALQLDATGYGYLSASNAGAGNVTLTVSGTDDTGTSYGASAPFTIQFAQNAVNGGVYYWDVTDTQIMDFQFGSVGVAPQIWMAPGDYGTSTADSTPLCVGCHTLSPDGTKIAASLGGQNDGRIIYLNDLTKVPTPAPPARTDPNYLTLNGTTANDGGEIEHIQFASFDPAGDQFVAVYGDTDTVLDGGKSSGLPAPSDNNLWFHDGNTGLVNPASTVPLNFEPDHPNWSPDGTMIAMTHVGTHNTSQREYSGGIDVATWSAGVLGTPVVILPSLTPGANQFNPNFVPDSSFLLYSVATCPVGKETNENCDSDVANNLDEAVATVDGGTTTYTTTTWAVKPTAGATPVHLDNAAAKGVTDTLPTIDTFPRSTPFKTIQGSGELFWFTVASQRAPGLRQKHATAGVDTAQTQQLLWMFAIDPAKIMAGKDGSYTGFFLPFQNFTTSNHIAEWTQKIVGSTAPPPAPPPPPPPPPPSPPPPPR